MGRSIASRFSYFLRGLHFIEMAYRYTNTDKWGDAWYSNLKPAEKLLFNYLCDNCDIAGFIEMNIKRWASDIGYDKSVIEGALKGLQRGFINSISGDCIYLRTYLKHQKNLPLNPEKNMAHRGIIKRFELYKDKFNIESIESFLEGASKGLQRGFKGASKGLQSPYGIGSGNGSGKGKSINIEFDIFWNLYDKKVGDKNACIKKWNNLKDVDRQKIIDTLPAFLSQIKDKQYQPFPATYLNQRRWENEIVASGQRFPTSKGDPQTYINKDWKPLP